MIRLSRTVRFCINPPDTDPDAPTPGRFNTFAAWPSMRGLGRYYEIQVECAGEPDAVTGYLLNIRDIDEAVRSAAIPLIADAVQRRPSVEPAQLLGPLFEAVNRALDGIARRLTWRLTPFYSVSREGRDMSQCIVRQQFEFAASHRLHAESLSDEENRRIFGKCNNPNGHGHNYRLEVAVEVASEGSEVRGQGSGVGEQRTDRAVTPSPPHPPFNLAALERIVSERIIERFDHKYLNRDTPEFAALMPSVENIAQICHDLLHPPLADAGFTLRHVTVWETDKTSCTYPG